MIISNLYANDNTELTIFDKRFGDFPEDSLISREWAEKLSRKTVLNIQSKVSLTKAFTDQYHPQHPTLIYNDVLENNEDSQHCRFMLYKASNNVSTTDVNGTLEFVQDLAEVKCFAASDNNNEEGEPPAYFDYKGNLFEIATAFIEDYMPGPDGTEILADLSQTLQKSALVALDLDNSVADNNGEGYFQSYGSPELAFNINAFYITAAGTFLPFVDLFPGASGGHTGEQSTEADSVSLELDRGMYFLILDENQGYFTIPFYAAVTKKIAYNCLPDRLIRKINSIESSLEVPPYVVQVLTTAGEVVDGEARCPSTATYASIEAALAKGQALRVIWGQNEAIDLPSNTDTLAVLNVTTIDWYSEQNKSSIILRCKIFNEDRVDEMSFTFPEDENYCVWKIEPSYILVPELPRTTNGTYALVGTVSGDTYKRFNYEWVLQT